MALRGLLDTSVVIATTVADLPEEAAILAATLAELHFGIHLAKDESTRALRLRRLAEIESRCAALPVDDVVARAYGELAALTAGAGRKVRTRVVDSSSPRPPACTKCRFTPGIAKTSSRSRRSLRSGACRARSAPSE